MTDPGTLVLTPRKQQAPGEKFVALRALLANSYHSIARGDVIRVTLLKISKNLPTRPLPTLNRRGAPHGRIFQ